MDDSFPNKKPKIEKEEVSTSSTAMGTDEDDHQDSFCKTRGAIFILHRLPFKPCPLHQMDLPPAAAAADDDDIRFSTENLAKTYLHPLIEILLSRLNQAGMVHRIYVNFGPMGYYELNPKSTYTMFQIQVTEFEAQLRDLFLNGEIPDSYPNQWKWRISPDLPTIISDLPPNCKKLGFINGQDTDGFPELEEYFEEDTSEEQIFLLVFGEIDMEDIEQDLDECVHVSEFDLTVLDTLVRVIPIIEKRWIRK